MALVQVPKNEVTMPNNMLDIGLYFNKDTSKFSLINKEGYEYAFRVENTDKILRGIPANTLVHMLGMAWKFEYNGKTYTAIRSTIQEVEAIQNSSAISELPDLDPDMIVAAAQAAPSGSKLVVYKIGEYEYGIRIEPRLAGGGFWGGMAGFLLGKAVVHVAGQIVCFGVAGAVGLVCPPLAPAVLAGMEAAITPTVEVASNTVALGTAVIGMVATGPV